MESMYVTPYPWANRDKTHMDLNKFYLSPEARTWTVNSTSLVKTGQVMVARWVEYQYYRVLIS